MKIAISSQNARSVTGHPGKCRKFWIYTIEEGKPKGRELLELAKEQMFHQHPANEPHPLDEVDVLISGMMAVWLQERMATFDVKALATPETDLDKTVADYLAGTLEETPVHVGHSHGKTAEPVRGKPIGIAIQPIKKS